MKIVILDGYTENPGDLSWDGFYELGDDVYIYDRTESEDLTIERIGEAEIVITNKVPITKAIVTACPTIKYIGVLATGYNVVDTISAKEAGIVVTNIPTYGTNAVGQFAIALLLEICHNIGHHDKEIKKGRWGELNNDFCFWDYPLIELSGKTIGLIGFGNIGRVTGRIAKALGMKILAFDINECGEGQEIGEYVSLDELLNKSDVISLHCPLSPTTQGLINKDNISKMKDGTIIINNSRGGLIVDADLADALNCGKIYAAGLDVVSVEPIEKNNPLLTAKNCIITPHISWAPRESRRRLMDIAVNNLYQFMQNTPVNIVN